MSSCEFQILQSSCSSGLLLCLCLPLLDLLEAPVIVDFFVGRFCWRYHGLGRVRGFFNRTWCGWCLCTSRICLDMRRLCLLVMDLLAACVILLLLVLLWLVLEMFFWELRILRPSCSYGFSALLVSLALLEASVIVDSCVDFVCVADFMVWVTYVLFSFAHGAGGVCIVVESELICGRWWS